MGEAVQEGSGQAGVAEDLRPAGEVQVGGDQHRPSLVALGEDAEEQFGARLGEGDEPDLVEDEQVQPEESALSSLLSRSCAWASVSSLMRPAAVAKRTRFSWRQAATPRAMAQCVFPVPVGPAKTTFSFPWM